jgi:hypothetical protein
MVMNLKERLVDWYLTRKTGKTKAEREFIAWYEQNVNYRATRIKNMFENFEHIVIVDINKFVDHAEPFTWVPCKDARQYFWPARPLGENAVWRFERVINCPATAWEWEINELGGEDKIFVATNNERDAMMIALKYMS